MSHVPPIAAESFVEKPLQKQSDITLLYRLYPFIRPQVPVLMLAILIVVAVTLLELSIPYITKVAIDSYLVPRYFATGESSGPKTPMIPIRISGPAAREIVEKHKDLFVVHDKETVLISRENLGRLNVGEIALIRKNDIRKTAAAAALVVAVAFAMFVLNFAQVMIMEYAGQKIMHSLRMKVFSHIQSQCVDFFLQNPVGRLVTRTTNDIQNMHEMFTSVLTFFFKDVFLVAGVATALVLISPHLALACFTVLPVAVLAAVFFTGAARKPFRMMRIKIAEINSIVSETIEGISILHIFSQEAGNFKKFSAANMGYYLAGIRQIHVVAVFMPIIEMLGTVALAIVIYTGGRGVLSGAITIGILAAFIAYIKMFFRPIRDIAEKYNITQNAMASAERIFQILSTNMPDGHEKTAAPVSPPLQIENIEFHDVHFSYVSDEPVLKGVSFSVKKGETAAIVGPTGSGKTTVANLIMRFYEPTRGDITVNGIDISEIPLQKLRKKIGFVMQDPFLFSGTLRDNILFGKQELSDDELGKIIELANCGPVVARLENGVDTVISGNGTSLSSGQRQLVSIARAFASDPDLVLFDEATSYIDLETEACIKRALANLSRNRITIIIAHRLATVRNADNILVMRHGKIIESGTHEQLIDKQGYYCRMSRMGL
ncbi:MAG: ABC transporter [Desulfococcus sp. 4484_241]|nr:MAG: ABC transporter [Desulfococcus sp. 4484_241]